jgi:hypothetical protein
MIVNTVFGEEKVITKTCVYCKQEKPLFDFPNHSGRKDNYDSRCRLCIKDRHRDVSILKKKARPMPQFCECCGKKPGETSRSRLTKLVLDHDPSTKQFRGWLCEDCNLAIGCLGDNIEGLNRALEYLKRSL